MRRTIGWIGVLIIVLAVSALMTIWSVRDEAVFGFLAGMGSLLIGVFVGALFAWFIAPLLDTEK